MAERNEEYHLTMGNAGFTNLAAVPGGVRP
jgi:hypothetical protein